ncbi:hypothetical protein OAG27_05235 [Flavobacteriaceae bacterium]|nr:hypothetical protein [Flavobacteriaceae bacterium]
MEFEYPIVTTKHLLIKEYKKLLETNKDVLVFDLGKGIIKQKQRALFNQRNSK